MSKVSGRWSRLLVPVVATLAVAPIAATAAAVAAPSNSGEAMPSTSVPDDADRTPADRIPADQIPGGPASSEPASDWPMPERPVPDVERSGGEGDDEDAAANDSPLAIIENAAVPTSVAGTGPVDSSLADDRGEHDALVPSAADAMSTGSTSAVSSGFFEVTGLPLVFPDIYLNDLTYRSITITNIGEVPLVVVIARDDPSGPHFSVGNRCFGTGARLDPGESCTIDYHLEPRAVGPLVDSSEPEVSVFDADSGDLLDQATFPVELRATGLFPFAVSPTSVVFPATELDDTSLAVVRITNVSPFGQILAVSGGEPSGPPFSLQDEDFGDPDARCSDVIDGFLLANETCILVYAFSPEYPGLVTDGAVVVVTSVDYETDEPIVSQPYSVLLEGTGGFLPFPLAVSPTVEFPDQPVGADAAVRFVTISNISDMSVEFDYHGAAPSHPSFGFDGYDGTTCDAGTPLDPGASCVLAYEFLPSTAGTFTDRVEIVITATDDLDVTLRATFVVELSGTAVDTSAPTTTVDDSDDPDDPDGGDPDGDGPDDGDPDVPDAGDPDEPGEVPTTAVVAESPATPAGHVAGELPRTGGATGWILAAAVLALLGGAQLLFAARPRGDDVCDRPSRT